jgi:ATPase subunit of ABC transporter with duplicated ATPase domains
VRVGSTGRQGHAAGRSVRYCPRPGGASGPSLEFRGIIKRFGGTLAVDQVDLEVRGGEILALLGENGAGSRR